ncbi:MULTISPECIES: hypothetical protein [Ehrlichia]|uniref:Uncharacterized protein n=1 Tax=Ehrlichia cf. muris str. EmCRT TaxID=1359167 RepID=A0A0F3N718_9RICK|nr:MULTISPECIES: hypothetical protein [Ehrlichia]KJV63497.1 hypothetical protein EMUCRT_0952 [Ehrlichia cf. muris str. EmCRT]OUC04201.1 hypothetical protein DB91_03945 [Ehrlichia sp. Wisconsin_h]
MNDLELYNEIKISADATDHSTFDTSSASSLTSLPNNSCIFNNNCISKFLFTLSPTSTNNQYIVNFTFEQHQNNAEQDLLKLMTGQFAVNFDQENHALVFNKGDTSIVLNEDMISSCLNYIKVIHKNHSIE